MSPRVQDPIPRIGLSHGDTAMAPTVGSGEPSGRATGEPGGTAEGDDNITEHGAKRSVGASRAGGEPTRRVCEPDLDNSIVKSAMGVCEPDSANAASERGAAAATHQMADAPRETEQGQVCETNPDPTRAYLIPDSLRETLRCVELLLLPHPVPQELPSLDPITITQAVRDSRKLLGTDIVYDEEFYLTHDIPDIEPHHFEANDAALINGQSLESILEAAITGKKLQGLQADKLREFFQGVPNVERAIEILTEGEKPFMRDGFTRNAGQECSINGSYREKRRLCNLAYRKLVEGGKAIIFSKDALARTDQMKKYHNSPTTWVEKADAWEGRTCMHLSKGSKNFPSVNSSIDDEASDAYYPFEALPLLPEIAEMACRQRDAHPGRLLSGATVDVKAAYNQFPKSVEAALLAATTIQVRDLSKPGGLKELVMFNGYGVFGHKKAGNVYGVLGGVIKRKHNLGQTVPRSETYVDDGVLISPDDDLDESLREYVEAVVALFGESGVNKKKVERWVGRLEAIGWDFCFQTWRVQPRRRGLAKMMVMPSTPYLQGPPSWNTGTWSGC